MGKTKTHSQFTLTLDALRTIAQHPEGMTVGELQGYMFGCTYGQVKRMLDTLLADNFIWAENVKHGRTGKNIYRVGENAAIVGTDIAQGFQIMLLDMNHGK
jgi:hypothetical protein